MNIKSKILTAREEFDAEKKCIIEESNKIKKELDDVTNKYEWLTNPHKLVEKKRDKFLFIENKIVAGVASFQKRADVFSVTVESILPQVISNARSN